MFSDVFSHPCHTWLLSAYNLTSLFSHGRFSSCSLATTISGKSIHWNEALLIHFINNSPIVLQCWCDTTCQQVFSETVLWKEFSRSLEDILVLCMSVLPVVTASHALCPEAHVLPLLTEVWGLSFRECCLGFTEGRAGPQALISFPTLKFLVGGNLVWKRQITSVRCIHEILFCLKEIFLPCFDCFFTVSQPMTHFHENSQTLC